MIKNLRNAGHISLKALRALKKVSAGTLKKMSVIPNPPSRENFPMKESMAQIFQVARTPGGRTAAGRSAQERTGPSRSNTRLPGR